MPAARLLTDAERDAILHSVGANATHGMRRTPEDERRAVLWLLEDAEWAAWSNYVIAEKCHVSKHLVRSLRPSRSEESVQEPPRERIYTTKHGTQATMGTTRNAR